MKTLLLLSMVILIGGCAKPSKMAPTIGTSIGTIESLPGGYNTEILIKDEVITIVNKELRRDNVWSAFGANLPDAKKGHTYKLSCKISSRQSVMGLSVAIEKDWINRPYTDAGSYDNKHFEVIFTPKTEPVSYLFITEAPGEFIITDLKVEEL